MTNLEGKDGQPIVGQDLTASHRFAAFHVLRRAYAPAVLFEAGYLSNVDDELLLRDPEHRKAIVLSLAQAIEADVASRSRR